MKRYKVKYYDPFKNMEITTEMTQSDINNFEKIGFEVNKLTMDQQIDEEIDRNHIDW